MINNEEETLIICWTFILYVFMCGQLSSDSCKELKEREVSGEVFLR